MATDDLIAALQGVGRVDSEGSFSFDREKAREKLRTFQVAEPQRFVLHFIALAALKGARAIAVECDSDDLIVRFDGAPVTALDLDDLYNASFAAADTDEQRARQQLAIGLHAALALNPRHVALISGEGEAAVSLRARHDRPDEISPARSATGGTTIHVKQRFRPGLMVRFVRHLRGGLAEAAWLRARGCYASVPITLNGEAISGGLQIAGASHCSSARDDGCSGVAGLVEGQDEGVLRMVRHGVWLCDEPLPWAPRGLVVVVANDRLLTDLSGDRVVLDGQHARCQALAERLAMAVVVDAIGGGAAVEPSPALRERLADVWQRWPAALDPGTPVGEAMGRVVAWPDLWDRSHSLAALRALVARLGHLPTSTGHFARRVPAGADIVVRGGDLGVDAVMERVFPGARKDVTAALEQRARAEVNRRRWRMQPCGPTLTAANYVLIAPLTAQLGERVVTGQVGLRRTPGETCTLRVIVDGCALAELELDAPIAGVDAVISGPLEIEDDFSAPARDVLFARCLGAWLLAARELAEAAVAGDRPPWPEGAALQALRHGLLRAFHPVDAVRATLRSAGYQDGVLVAQGERLLADMRLTHAPDDLADRTWARDAFEFQTAAGPKLSAAAIAEALRRGLPLHWVPATFEAHPRISEPVLRAYLREAQALTWLFGDRVRRMSAGEYEDLLGEARLLATERRPLGLPLATHTPSVCVAHDGLQVALAFPRDREAWTRRSLRSRCDIFRGERLLTQVELWSPVPGASFAIDGDHLTVRPRWDGIIPDDLFEETRVKLVAAVPALLRLALTRPGGEDAAVDDAWRRGLLSALTASLPSRPLRAAYTHVLAKRGRALADRTLVRLLALAAGTSVKLVSDHISASTDDLGVLMDIKQLAAAVSAPPPDQNTVADVEAVLRALRELFGQTGGASWLDDVMTFSPEVGALPLLRRVDGTPVTLAEARAEALADGLSMHAIERDASPPAHRRSLRANSFTREVLITLFGEHRLRRGEPGERSSTAPAQPGSERAPPEKPICAPERREGSRAQVEQDTPPSPLEQAAMFLRLQRAADVRASTAPPAAVPTPPAPPPPDPGERLIAAVQAELQALRRGHESLLTGFNVDHVRGVQGTGEAMISIDPAGLHIDLAHPLVQRAIAGYTDDRLWISFLASRVYTALNVWRADITDVDEANFHARHLAWLHGELERGGPP